MIIKIDDRKIKHQPNTEMFFWDRDNLLKRETKPVMKLNSQLTQYLRMKSKKIIKKINKFKLVRPTNQNNKPNLWISPWTL